MFNAARKRKDLIQNQPIISSERNVVSNNEVCVREMSGVCSYEASLPREKSLVSIIVPCYNHVKYLKERLDTIYGQSYDNFEVILLDDASTDESVDILRSYAEIHATKTKLILNKDNSGRVSKQWELGFSIAKGKYIWIAESDDYCSSNFLEEMVQLMNNRSVMLAFANSIFIRDGKEFWRLEKHLKDLDGFTWNEPFFVSAHTAVRKGFAWKNMIPNVSSVLFRNPIALPNELIALWKDVNLVHDWLLYLSMIKGGSIAYTNKATNYYRFHGESTALKIRKTEKYYKEIEMVSLFAARHYDVEPSIWDALFADLIVRYKTAHPTQNPANIEQYYRVEMIKNEMRKRLPNIAICIYSLVAGREEILPIHIANEMKRHGLSVTIFSLNLAKNEPIVSDLVHANVPIVALDKPNELVSFIEKMRLFEIEIELVHSRHANLDTLITDVIGIGNRKLKSVIFLHGMYEAISESSVKVTIEKIDKSCSRFCSLLEKNIEPSCEHSNFLHDSLVKQLNVLLAFPVAPVKKVADIMATVANDKCLYAKMSTKIPSVSKKLKVDKIIEKCVEAYKRIIDEAEQIVSENFDPASNDSYGPKAVDATENSYLGYAQLKFKYIRYKILSNITWGALRYDYKQKRLMLKEKLRRMQSR